MTNTTSKAEIESLAARLLAAEQATPKAAPGELHDHQILAITTAYEQGVGKGRQAHESGKEIANPYDTGYRCDLAWQYGYEEGKKQAERIAEAAAQQEAQEPCGWPEDRVRIEKTEKNGWCAYLDIGNKHRVRIGTIILCRGINSENEARALAQNWMRDFVPNPKQVAAPQQEAQEPFAWESTTPGYIKYITQARYEKFSPNVQRWYKPYRCSGCAERGAGFDACDMATAAAQGFRRGQAAAKQEG